MYAPANDNPPPMDSGDSDKSSNKGRGENSQSDSILQPSWMVSLTHNLHNHPSATGSERQRYRLSYRLRGVDYDVSKPQIVCFGQLRLQYSISLDAVEKQKWSYLQEAVSAIDGGGLETFVKEIKELQETLLSCYFEPFDRIDGNDLIEMMVVDGCFIVMLLLKETQRWPIGSDDLIFKKRWLFYMLQRDLLLLENQIPFFVLERLFNLIASSSQGIGSVSFLTVVQEFFKDKMETAGSSAPHVDDPKHLLQVLHSNLFPDLDGRKKKASSITDLKPIPGAGELFAAGVVLSSSNPDRLDIRFDDGVLKIPHCVVDDHTHSLFSNLIAFEQSDPQCNERVTAYAFFMDCLTNTAEDVAVLCRKGILDNYLGSHQDVADLFSQLGRRMIIYSDQVYMADVIDRINAHCSIQRNSRRKLPWAISFLTAAIFILVLTIFLQTFFSFFKYFHPPS